MSRRTSIAPPPVTTSPFFIARFTTMMASCKLRSTSSMNCSAPPLRIKVQVFALGQSSNTLYLSPPICLSSKVRSGYTTCAEDIPIGEPLRRQIPNGEFAQNDLSASLFDKLEFAVDD